MYTERETAKLAINSDLETVWRAAATAVDVAHLSLDCSDYRRMAISMVEASQIGVKQQIYYYRLYISDVTDHFLFSTINRNLSSYPDAGQKVTKK